ncbi:putative ribonuclease H-like domain-containing protein [Tanacetum coccineum]
MQHTAAKVRPRKSSTNSKAEEFLTELQPLKTQERTSQHSPHKVKILGDPKLSMQTEQSAATIKRTCTCDWNKWVYRKQKDERGVVVRNKARLVAQGHRQEDGINYDEVFAPVARIEVISLVVLIILKEGFMVVKALNMGLHQGLLELGYATLLTFLETHRYRRGTINKTLFIKRDKKDIMLVQVYVNDIIFGSTRKFLIASKTKDRWNFHFSRQVYVADMLKKFDLASGKTAITTMETR